MRLGRAPVTDTRRATLCGSCFQDFEKHLLEELEWRLCAPKPHDFLEEFLYALPLPLNVTEAAQIRHHAAIFVDMCYTGEQETKKNKKRRKEKREREREREREKKRHGGDTRQRRKRKEK